MGYTSQGFVVADDGTRLFYEEGGRGRTVALLDGIGCDGFAWKYLGPALAENYRIVHPHYRGHGRSGPPRDLARLGIASLAQDLRCVLDHLKAEQVILVGHSMGTQVALEFYRSFPERVAALVLLCGSYGKVTHHFHGTNVLSQILPAVIRSVQRHQPLARALWGRFPSWLAYRGAKLIREVDAFNIREEDFRQYWDHVAILDPDIFLAMLQKAGEHSAEDLLSRISVPTLVLAAERDTFTPAALATGMAEAIPNAEHHLIEGGSHAAPVEQPRVIERRIRTFLQAAGVKNRQTAA